MQLLPSGAAWQGLQCSALQPDCCARPGTEWREKIKVGTLAAMQRPEVLDKVRCTKRRHLMPPKKEKVGAFLCHAFVANEVVERHQVTWCHPTACCCLSA
jgi:hypothetical protein